MRGGAFEPNKSIMWEPLAAPQQPDNTNHILSTNNAMLLKFGKDKKKDKKKIKIRKRLERRSKQARWGGRPQLPIWAPGTPSQHSRKLEK